MGDDNLPIDNYWKTLRHDTEESLQHNNFNNNGCSTDPQNNITWEIDLRRNDINSESDIGSPINGNSETSSRGNDESGDQGK